MKKLGQKLSFLTKILLVVGLLISNLSSLSVVFAYEVPADMVVNLVDESLEIEYNEELAEEVKAVNIIVYEKYTYLDGTPETFGGTEEEVKNVYPLTAEELLEAKKGTLELAYDSIFANEEETLNNFELFDGTYDVRVEIVDVTDYSEVVLDTTTVEPETTDEVAVEANETEIEENEELQTMVEEALNEEEPVTGVILAYGTYEEKMSHDSGLSVKVFNSLGEEITLVSGKYPVSHEDARISVVAKLLPGGLNPTDVFEYDGKGYFAYELVDQEIPVLEKNFNGLLYGDYELPFEVKFTKPVEVENEADSEYEEVVYKESVKVLYGTYELNTEVLNTTTASLGYNENYLFYGTKANGILYSYIGFEDATEETVVTKTMLDLYNIVNSSLQVYGKDQLISYKLLQNDMDVLESYVPASEEDTLEDYLATITLDDTVKVVLTSEDLTVTYRVVVVADLNNDNILTEEDVLQLINQFVGETEVTDIEKSDLTGNEKVDSLDVVGLNQVVQNQDWNVSLNETEVELNANLEVKLNGENVSEDNYLTSGDKFTVDYVLSLSEYEVNGAAGLFSYDKTLFELISVDVTEVTKDWLGNYHEGKFIYIGEDSLTYPEENVDLEVNESENADEVQELQTLDYVLVSATFTALKGTTEESDNVITLEEIELFNSVDNNITYYVLDKNELSTEAIEVMVSEDNTLSYLEVAGVEIALEDGVYDYEITVDSDVTAVDLKYIVSNIAANITSIISPEELVEGKNTIVVTVTSEAGVSQDYTITVIREKEETTTQVSYDNYYGDYETEEEEIVVTPGVEDKEEEEPVKEKTNLSRIVIIVLILLVIAGLVYLIFKDDDDETKKANKAVNKLKKEDLQPEVKRVEKTSNNKNVKSNNNNKKNKGSKNNKKER